jgi:hypothetical protein
MRVLKHKQGRKPVDLTAAGPKPYGRDAIWSEIRRQRDFTFRSIEDATDIPKKTIKTYVESLVAAGIVEQTGVGENKQRLFKLVADKGVHAPRVRKDGSESEQGRASESMWTAMRLMKQFSPRDLAINASTEEVPVSEVHAKDYCKFLSRARYLRVVKPSKPGTQAVYQFVRFTGPRAPMVQRVKQVFDPNTGTVVWPGKEDADQ